MLLEKQGRDDGCWRLCWSQLRRRSPLSLHQKSVFRNLHSYNSLPQSWEYSWPVNSKAPLAQLPQVLRIVHKAFAEPQAKPKVTELHGASAIGLLRRFHQQEAQQNVALLADVAQSAPISAGLFHRHQPHVAGNLLGAGKTFRRSNY
jgi:hypothetical protein